MDRQNWGSFRKKIKRYYRLVVMDNATYKERMSFRFTPFTLIVMMIVSVVVLVSLTSILIAYTPLREYIPGYGSMKQKSQIWQLTQRLDSLENVYSQNMHYERAIRAIVLGEEDENNDYFTDTTTIVEEDTILNLSKWDSLLLKINVLKKTNNTNNLLVVKKVKLQKKEDLLLFNPFGGQILNDLVLNDNGIDIECKHSMSIFAIKAGTIVHVGKELDNYYCMIHHPDNIFSLYTLKNQPIVQVGQVVKAKEIIAIAEDNQIVHFELWIDGMAVNPQEYILF